MSAKESIAFEIAIASLSDQNRVIAEKLHEEAVSLGYTPLISAVGTKSDEYKCEYKKSKPARTLFILRISGLNCSVRLKLFHLGEYSEKIAELTESARSHLLLSKACGFHPGGCKGPVHFVYGEREYSVCRHSIQIGNLSIHDVPGIVGLLRCENQFIP